MLTLPLRVGSFYEEKRGFKNHEEYLARIEKSLYYVNIPKAYCTSLPCTELAAEIFSEINKFSIDQLHIEEAAKLSHNACVTPCSLVLALLYLDRLKAINPKYLTRVSPSELFLISLMVGSKFLQDDGEEDEVNNYEWAASAGLDVQDLNRAEKQFLDAIRWKVFVSEKEFWDKFHLLECKLGMKQGCKRGWFTYTELHLLLECIDITNIIQAFCTVTTACLTSYTASLLTLLGSALLVSQIPGLGLKPKPENFSLNQIWNSMSYNLTPNTTVEQNLQDCPATLALSLIILEDNIGHKLKFRENLYNFNDLGVTNCVNSNNVELFLKIPPPPMSGDKSYNYLKEISVKNPEQLFNTDGNVWDWADIIMNYLLMNSMSNTLFPLKAF